MPYLFAEDALLAEVILGFGLLPPSQQRKVVRAIKRLVFIGEGTARR